MVALSDMKNYLSNTVSSLGLPAAQVGLATLVGAGLGKLGQYGVTVQTTAALSAVAALTGAIADKVFADNSFVQYLAIPSGLALSVLAHGLIYRAASFATVLDAKSGLAITVSLAVTKFVVDALKKQANDEV